MAGVFLCEIREEVNDKLFKKLNINIKEIFQYFVLCVNEKTRVNKMLILLTLVYVCYYNVTQVYHTFMIKCRGTTF